MPPSPKPVLTNCGPGTGVLIRVMLFLRLGLGLGLGLVFYLTWRRISRFFVDVGARRSNLARSAAQSLQTLLHARDG